MHDEETAGEFGEVFADRVRGEQVRGDGVARESIHEEHVEVAGIGVQAEAAVEEAYFVFAGAFLEEGEFLAGYFFGERVDLPENDFVLRTDVGGDGARAEADNADADGNRV